MRPSEQFNQRGMAATRHAIALAVAKATGIPAADIARARWGSAPTIRSAIGGGGFAGDSDSWGSELVLPQEAGAEFVSLTNEISVFGQLAPQMRRVPLNTKTAAQTARASVGFVGSGKPIPVSPLAFSPVALNVLTLGGLVVISDELARDSSQQAEYAIRKDLVQAVAEGTDLHFLSPSEAAIAEFQPASVTNGIAPLNSTDDPAEDIRELVENFPGDFSKAVWVTSPQNAARLALYRDAAGNYPFMDAGPRGGSILNMPLIASNNCPLDSSGDFLALIDPSAIVHADDGIEFFASKEGTIIQSSDPENSSEAPMVSMFQSDSVALKTVRRINWRIARPAVSWMWANYSPASSS